MILDEARRREFVNFYRAIETFALSRHSSSALAVVWKLKEDYPENLEDIDGDRFLLSLLLFQLFF